ncbi:MAG: hypothetical protein J6X18_04780 [Bacteroidales bacterium]|nr:hypothetical protein [Bacteroidales bacterium]
MKKEEKLNFVLTKRHWIGISIATLLIVFLCCLGRIGEDVKNEEIVVNQRAFSGKMEYWTEPGFKWQMFGRTTSYYKTQQYWFGGKDIDGESHGKPIEVIFNDASVGYIYGSLRVKLPTDVEHLSRIQTAYTGMNRLMNDLVAQNVTKVIYASGPLMSAFESYAEKKNDLIAYITDQLMYGVYKTQVEEVVTIDAFTGEEKKIKVASLIHNNNAPQGYVRSETSPFSDYGVVVDQVSISKIEYDDKVNQQISAQQQANMSIQTKKAEALAAQQEAIKAESEGKAAAAKAKWEQEKLKATAVTKAEQEREVARLAAEQAEFDKKRIIAEGQAESEANRLKVAAGLSPQERAEWEYKTAVGIAKELAGSNVRWVPEIMINGNGSGNGNSAMDAVGFNMMLDILQKMNKK